MASDLDSNVLRAIEGRQAMDVREALELGGSPDARHDDGRSALALAVEVGVCAIVDVLLSFGADPNLGDRYDATPLMDAAGRGFFGAAESPQKAGAEPDAFNGACSPLLAAAGNGDGDVWTIAALVQAGADLERPDHFGRTPLALAVFVANTENMDKLLELGARMDSPSMEEPLLDAKKWCPEVSKVRARLAPKIPADLRRGLRTAGPSPTTPIASENENGPEGPLNFWEGRRSGRSHQWR